MMNHHHSAVTAAALAVIGLLAACSPADPESPRTTTAPTTAPAEVETGPSPAAADASDGTCPDEAELADQENHEPAGWPAGYDEGENLPNPECHPDFIPLAEWEHQDSECTDPVAHRPIPTDEELIADGQQTVPVLDRWRMEWEASSVRAEWTPPAEGESCQGH